MPWRSALPDSGVGVGVGRSGGDTVAWGDHLRFLVSLLIALGALRVLRKL